VATQFKKAKQVQILDQKYYPVLPEIPTDTILLIIQSNWQKAEREWAAGIIITACIRAGEWKPITSSTFLSLLQNPMFTFGAQGIINEVLAFGEEGILELEEVGDIQYIVPTPQFASVALAETNQFRVTN
jgi:hypothetical protein